MNSKIDTTMKKIQVDIGTSLGHIVIEMDPQLAPKTVKHMVDLFESGHYIGAGLFRVGSGHVIQIGDMDCELVYRVPPMLSLEPEEVKSRNLRGTIALNNAGGEGSSQSTFFFNMANNYHLNPIQTKRVDQDEKLNEVSYPTFGKVVEGMDILDSMIKTRKCPSIDLNGTPSEEDAKKYPVVVTSITIG